MTVNTKGTTMQDFKFVSIKEKKDEKLATFKSVSRFHDTEITISLSTLVESEEENFETLVSALKTQAVADFKKSLPLSF